MTEWRAIAAMLEAGLKRRATLIERRGQSDWDFAVKNGGAVLGHARLTEDWVLFDLPFGGVLDAREAWRLLALNGRLGANVKFALRGRAVHLRAEIPVTPDTDLAWRVESTCRALEEGLEPALQESPSAPEAAGASACRQMRLVTLLEEAGWPAIERDAERCAVELEVGTHSYHQALVERGHDGLRITAELVSWSEPAEESRNALAILLLKANWGIRLARAAGEDGGSVRAWFEAACASAPDPGQLSVALGALSVACRIAGREAAALEEPELAMHYLRMQGYREKLQGL